MVDIGQNSATDFIKPHGREALKQYIVYDALYRMIAVYEAVADTAVGDQCLKTEYAYDGGSSRIVKMKESLATWQAGWDI